MCTLSILIIDQIRFFFMNRDEAHSRANALLPRRQQPSMQLPNQLPQHQVLYPIDPPNGTWIGCNSYGLAAALLNYNPTTKGAWQPSSTSVSRGTIIPHLLASKTCGEAEGQLQALSLAAYAYFRLILTDKNCVDEWTWDGTNLHKVSMLTNGARPHDTRHAFCWASSGLGDQLVQEHRYPIFDQHIAGPLNDLSRTELIEAQTNFHQNRQGNNGSLWVKMFRDDARSVSQTEITISETQAAMRYRHLWQDGGESAWHTSSLPVIAETL